MWPGYGWAREARVELEGVYDHVPNEDGTGTWESSLRVNVLVPVEIGGGEGLENERAENALRQLKKGIRHER